MIEELLEYNKKFVQNNSAKSYITEKYPHKKIAILSCMDTRLTALLPAALGLKNGDAKIIKNAGAMITSAFGSVMRSLIVAVYNLGVCEILVIGHRDCGMLSLDSNDVLVKMKARGVSEEAINAVKNSGTDIENWLRGFDCTEASVKDTVEKIQTHPLMPKDINVYGLIIDEITGNIEPV